MEVKYTLRGQVLSHMIRCKYFRRTSASKDTNALHTVMLECKLAQGKVDAFVRDVTAAPESMADSRPKTILY